METVLFFLLLAACLLIFVFGSSYYTLFATNKSLIYKLSLVVFFWLVTLYFQYFTDQWQYCQIAYVLFTAATANLLTGYVNPWLLKTFKLSDKTVKGIALSKLSETNLVVVTIIVLLAFTDMGGAAVYLQTGRLGLGLVIGALTFIGFAVIAWLQAKSQKITSQTLRSLLPWILIFVFANAFMEELWFRALFLKYFEPAIGAGGALILTAILFAFIHIGASYMSRSKLVQFMVILFPLGLLWGYLMQLTDSIIASTMFHAGGDLLIINGFIASLNGPEADGDGK